MNLYVLLAISIVLAVLNNYFLHRMGNGNTGNIGNVLLFNAAISAIWIVILLFVDRGFHIPSATAIWFGVFYGLVVAGFLLSKMQALASGPMSLTTLISCCSLIVPTVFGAVFWQEKVNGLQILGIVALLAAIFMCAYKKKDKDVASILSLRWKLYSTAFFVCAGTVGLIFKIFQSSTAKNEINGMMIVAAIVSAAVLASMALLVNHQRHLGLPTIDRQVLAYVLLCGLVSCGYNRLNIYLTGVLPSIIFFPVFNGCVILSASLVGFVRFREKLSQRQIAGLALGTVAIMLIGKVFNGLFQ